jgi:hypothetical protein
MYYIPYESYYNLFYTYYTPYCTYLLRIYTYLFGHLIRFGTTLYISMLTYNRTVNINPSDFLSGRQNQEIRRPFLFK